MGEPYSSGILQGAGCPTCSFHPCRWHPLGPNSQLVSPSPSKGMRQRSFRFDATHCGLASEITFIGEVAHPLCELTTTCQTGAALDLAKSWFWGSVSLDPQKAQPGLCSIGGTT